MPRLAHSPCPVRPAPARPSAFRGAREGRVRWRADLGLGRHLEDRRFWGWYHRPPRAPLVRADGVVLTDWNGVVVAHAPGDGARAWALDLTIEPDKAWHEYWGGILLVDVEDHIWVETQRGLSRLGLDGEREIVAAGLTAGGFSNSVGIPVPHGFLRRYGTDEHWYTGHWPCEQGVVELLDDHGRSVWAHEVGLCPTTVHRRDDGRIIAFFTDAAEGKREVALEIDDDGELIARHETEATGRELASFRRDLLGDAVPPPVPSAPSCHAIVASPGGSIAVSVEWGRAIRLHHGDRGAVLDSVSADQPAVGADGRVYATRVCDGSLTLVGLDAGEIAIEVPLVEDADLSIFAFDHAGRTADHWRSTGWFHAPSAIGPDGTTLVVTNLAAGRAELICVG